jgi:predicted PurR-regulated permease PerM
MEEKTKRNYTGEINRLLAVLVIALGVFVLHAGRSFLIPFVVALAIFFVLTIFENLIFKAIKKIVSFFRKKEISERLSANISYAAFGLSLAISVFILFSAYKAISMNFDDMLSNTTKYQMLFNGKIAQFNNFVRSSQNPEENTNLSHFQQLFSAIPESHLPVIDYKIISQINFNYSFNKVGAFAGKGVANFMLVLVYLLFLYLERRNFRTKIEKITAKNPKFKKMQKTVNEIGGDLVKYFTIKTIVSVITAALCYFVMTFFGLDFVWLWTFTIFILNFIPTIGSIVATILPTVLGLIVFDSVIDAVLMGAIITAIQFTIGSVIEPKFQGDRLNLSPLMILLSLAVWGAIWGVVGMFLAVPIMVTINAALAQFETTKPLAMFFSSNGEIKD